MTTALIYVRQSRHKEYERTASPAVQEAACRALPAVARCHQVEVFTDLDVSGGKRARRGYDAMLARIRAGGVATVAAYDQSRAFRSTLIAAEFKALLEERAHESIEVVFVHGTFDRSPVGGFSYAVLAAAHEMERKMTGEKIRAGKRHQAALGAMVGAVPAGYVRHKDGSVMIHEPTATIVRRIFSDYAGGALSTRAIASRLNVEGVRLPSFKTAWRADTVAQMLGNEAYIALTYSERRSKRGARVDLRPQGEPMAAQWPALVERATWDAVRSKLARFHRKGGRAQQATGRERSYAFQGLLRCLTCGGRMQCHHMGGRDYYQCRGGKKNGCQGIRDDGLREWARGLLVWIEERVDFDLRFDQAPVKPVSVDSIARIEATMQRLGQRYEWGDIPEGAYRTKLAEYRALRAQAAAELNRAAERPQSRPWPTNLVGTWDGVKPDSKRRLLEIFFEEIDVEAGEVIGGKARPVMASISDLISQYRGSSPGGVRTRDLSLERAAS